MTADKWVQFGEDPYREAVSAGVLPGDLLTIRGARLVPGIGPVDQECIVEVLRYNQTAIVAKKPFDKNKERRVIEWNRVKSWCKK